MKNVEIISTRKYKAGYEVRTEKYPDYDNMIMKVAYNQNGDYIGDSKTAHRLVVRRGIIPELARPDNRVCSIGFCEKEQKWYGWSHRAMFGFGVGSTVKREDCAFTADNPEDMIEDYANFFADISPEHGEEKRNECFIAADRSGIYINHMGYVLPVMNSIDELKSALDGKADLKTERVLNGLTFRPCGKGEWTAQTLEEAKQMAIDFADGVS